QARRSIPFRGRAGLQNNLSIIVSFHRIEESANGPVTADREHDCGDGELPVDGDYVGVLAGSDGVNESGAGTRLLRGRDRLDLPPAGNTNGDGILLDFRKVEVDRVGALFVLERRGLRSLKERQRNENTMARGSSEARDAYGAFDADWIGIFIPPAHIGNF